MTSDGCKRTTKDTKNTKAGALPYKALKAVHKPRDVEIHQQPDATAACLHIRQQLRLMNGAHLSNGAGTTNRLTPAGSPYVNVPANPLLGLQPGMQLQVTLSYDRVSLRGVSFTPRVLAGPGLR